MMVNPLYNQNVTLGWGDIEQGMAGASSVYAAPW
jgi:hypothetical protein